MGTKLGDDVLLWVESAVAGTYNYVAGQGDLTRSNSTNNIDLSSKTDGAIAAQAQGRGTLTMKLSLKPKLPDANGYGRLRTLCNVYPGAPFKVQLRKGGTGGLPADVLFECSMWGNIDSESFPQNGALAAEVTLSADTAPVTDILA